MKKLAEGTEEKLFYQQKIETARFFLNKVLAQHYSLLASLTAGLDVLEIVD